MILVLDDDPERHRRFHQGLFGATVQHVTRADKAIQLLRARPWSVVLLDHDLDQHGDATAGTGMQVVDWMVEHRAAFQRSVVIVHSINPIFGPIMLTKLRSAGIRSGRSPRLWLDEAQLDSLVLLDQRASL